MGGKGKEGRRGKRLVDSTHLSSLLALARELDRTTPFRDGFADGPVMNRLGPGSVGQHNYKRLSTQILSTRRV